LIRCGRARTPAVESKRDYFLGSVVVVVVVDGVVAGGEAGDVVVVVVDGEAGGVDEAGGGTTTVVDGEAGGADDVGVVDGVCCWQAPSASSTLAATAMDVSRFISSTPSLGRPFHPA
jgi:hypothetical protein